jgi:hypothetical protein
MEISLEQARRLFATANDFHTGKAKYIPTDSEIRSISLGVFHSETVSVMTHVITEIFRVLAVHYMEERNNGTERT